MTQLVGVAKRQVRTIDNTREIVTSRPCNFDSCSSFLCSVSSNHKIMILLAFHEDQLMSQ